MEFLKDKKILLRWISANPGLKFNPLFRFVYFCTSVYFKISEKETPIDPNKISEFIDELTGKQVCFEF